MVYVVVGSSSASSLKQRSRGMREKAGMGRNRYLGGPKVKDWLTTESGVRRRRDGG